MVITLCYSSQPEDIFLTPHTTGYIYMRFIYILYFVACLKVKISWNQQICENTSNFYRALFVLYEATGEKHFN